MEGEEHFQSKEKYQGNPLAEDYVLVHKKEPMNMEEWQIAQNIVEVIGNESRVPSNLEKECIYWIINSVSYPNDETRRSIILMAEESVRTVFPELSHIDEVHMDQIDYAYRQWRAKQNL